MSILKTQENTSAYSEGLLDVRSWGFYIVTSVVKINDTVTQCQKDICIFPKQMLSLQVHKGRDERWTVKKGTLTVIINGKSMEINEGQSVELKARDIHCMINLTNKMVKVHEVQSGVCEELDNVRIMDFGGRNTVDYNQPNVDISRKLYQQFMDNMPKNRDNFFNKVNNLIYKWFYRVKLSLIKGH